MKREQAPSVLVVPQVPLPLGEKRIAPHERPAPEVTSVQERAPDPNQIELEWAALAESSAGALLESLTSSAGPVHGPAPRPLTGDRGSVAAQKRRLELERAAAAAGWSRKNIRAAPTAELERAVEEHEATVMEPAELPRARAPRSRAEWRPVSSPERRARFAHALRQENAETGIVDWTDDELACASSLEAARCEGRAMPELVRHALRELPDEVANVLRHVALDDGRTWADPWARRIVAFFVVVWRASIGAKRPGFWRLLTGRSRQMLGTLFRLTPSEQRKRKTKRGARPHFNTVMRRVVAPLEAAGLLYVEQPPADCCDPSLVMRHWRRDANGEPRLEAHALNHYWVYQLDELDDDERAELDELLGPPRFARGWRPAAPERPPDVQAA